LGILALLVLELVISIFMYRCRRRQPMPKKSEKDLKEHIYEIPANVIEVGYIWVAAHQKKYL